MYNDEHNLYHYTYRKDGSEAEAHSAPQPGPVQDHNSGPQQPVQEMKPVKKNRIGLKVTALALCCALLPASAAASSFAAFLGAFGGVLFTGYHAWGCCGGNPLSHTMTTACDQVTLNGVPASEFLINAYTALYFGVPVAFLSGDRELCAFAQDWLPGLVAVPVNEGRGGGVLSMHPQAAVEAIRAGAEEAVRRLRAGGAGMSVPLPRRFAATVSYKEHKDAYRRSFYPGARLEDSKTISFDAEDWYEVLRFCHFVL